jgi:N-acylneuraminate cytidylyltransferase
LAGRPLYRHAVDLALEAGAARVLISTDIPQVLDAAHPPAVQALHRPAELCADETPMAPVLVHAIGATAIDGAVVLLQATSPLRALEDIASALERYRSGNFDLVMSVTTADRGVQKWGRIDNDRFVPLSLPQHVFSNRQALPPLVKPNGAIYVFDAQAFVARGGFPVDRIGAVEMPAERSQDIDTLADFEFCERQLMERRIP